MSQCEASQCNSSAGHRVQTRGVTVWLCGVHATALNDVIHYAPDTAPREHRPVTHKTNRFDEADRAANNRPRRRGEHDFAMPHDVRYPAEPGMTEGCPPNCPARRDVPRLVVPPAPVPTRSRRNRRGQRGDKR